MDSWTDKLPLAARPPSLADTTGGTDYRATLDPPSADRNGLVKLDHFMGSATLFFGRLVVVAAGGSALRSSDPRRGAYGVGQFAPMTRIKDGRSWRIGDAAEIAWLEEGTATGLEITSAIPPILQAYATVVVPEDHEDRDEHDRALVTILSEQTVDQPWRLGYLDTGADDVVFYDVPMVTLYAGSWHYVVVEAGPHEASQLGGPFVVEGSAPGVDVPCRSFVVGLHVVGRRLEVRRWLRRSHRSYGTRRSP